MELFTPAWKGKNEKRALKAVEKMTDPQQLTRVAKEAYCLRARRVAIEKLTDRTVIADVAKNVEDPHLRVNPGIKKLTDPAVLAHIAKNDEDSDVRIAAVKNLTDQTVLAAIAGNDENIDVRMAAIQKLDSEELFLRALGDVSAFDGYGIEKQIAIARVLVSAAEKFGPPLNIRWKAVECWIKKIPVPHGDCPVFDVDHLDGDICCVHSDSPLDNIPSFPSYPYITSAEPEPHKNNTGTESEKPYE